ncbi:MAG TPA: PAS domain-containing protein [Polyangiaceae bacterium]|nr:PAS domain-containing protein [Polyangiaceae bacterium]
MSSPVDEGWARKVLTGLPFFLWTADAQGTLTYVDPRLLALLGFDPASELPLSFWDDRIHADDRDVTARAWQKAMSDATEMRIECRLRRADGSYRWFESRARPLLGNDGRPAQWVGSTDDIEKEVATRSALRAEQLRLANTAEASPAMLFSFWQGLDGRACFPYVSPTFAKLFQIDPQEVAIDPTSFFRLANPEDNAEIGRTVELSRQTLSLWRHQWRITAPGKGELWMECHSMPVREADGSTTWHGTLADVTELRRIDEQLRELNMNLERRVEQRTAELESANRELESANRELEAFSYSVSHDLREPLRAINGFSKALIEDFGATLPPQAQHFLDNIRQGALRMGQLIDDLLAFSRLSRQPLKRRPLDMRALVDDCLRRLALAYPTTSVTLGTLAACNADAGLIEQVLLNLLGNAFKYSRKNPAPAIHIDSQQDDAQRTVYSVRDNGTGFNMKYAGKLFQVFQRLHRSGEFEGTGVGLAIVHRIVTRHGGRVWAEAEPERGATFFFTLEE